MHKIPSQIFHKLWTLIKLKSTKNRSMVIEFSFSKSETSFSKYTQITWWSWCDL